MPVEWQRATIHRMYSLSYYLFINYLSGMRKCSRDGAIGLEFTPVSNEAMGFFSSRKAQDSYIADDKSVVQVIRSRFVSHHLNLSQDEL